MIFIGLENELHANYVICLHYEWVVTFTSRTYEFLLSFIFLMIVGFSLDMSKCTLLLDQHIG
jgi:hypothetical protein